MNTMNTLDSLMLDAKQAILDEQHRRFQVLHQEGRWPEAMRQIHATLTCASDLLSESLGILDRLIARQAPPQTDTEKCHSPHTPMS
ncbi:MAG: hypothetical protein ACT4OO_14990 [Nitrospiraceae bacterium]